MFNRCIYFNLSTLNRQITQIWQEEFSALGVSASHGYLLHAIAEKPQATQKDFSALMELDASTITRFIDTLAAKKLIEKSGAGKGTTYTLTAKGNALVKKIDLLMDDLYARMQRTFGKKHFSDFVFNLQNAKETIKEGTA